LTSFDYFYGQYADVYDLRTSSGADKIVATFGDTYEYVFQNGSSAELLGVFYRSNASIVV
jgi:hypothetical protein